MNKYANMPIPANIRISLDTVIPLEAVSIFDVGDVSSLYPFLYNSTI